MTYKSTKYFLNYRVSPQSIDPPAPMVIDDGIRPSERTCTSAYIHPIS